jgi:hypothetical protein
MNEDIFTCIGTPESAISTSGECCGCGARSFVSAGSISGA